MIHRASDDVGYHWAVIDKTRRHGGDRASGQAGRAGGGAGLDVTAGKAARARVDGRHAGGGQGGSHSKALFLLLAYITIFSSPRLIWIHFLS